MCDNLRKFLCEGCRQGYYPGAVAAIDFHGETRWVACGRQTPEKTAREIQIDTIFDIASLTKPVATGTAVLQLIEAGNLRLDTPIVEILPELGFDPEKETITIHHLLTHTSGLPAWKPLYIMCASPDRALATIAGVPLESKPGFRVEYSCLGFVLLAEAIRRQSGLTLASYCERSIFKPLNMRSTLFNPPSKLRHRIAPTEEGNAFERSMAGDSGDQYPNWRVHRLHGEVHDGNAWFAGGEGGNAGLFSTAEDLTRFCRCMLNGGSFDKTRILSRETVEFATRNHTAALNLHRGLGWQMASTTRTAGSRLSLRAYGHTGFTGTSIWIDPEFDLAIVFLTNRIWYGGAGDAFGRFRGALHDTIMESITEKS